MLDNKALTELVETVIRRQFSDAVIHSVVVRPDVDHDGDDILRVTVVVQDGIEKLDPDKVLDTSGSLWSELGEAGIMALDSGKKLGLVRHLRPELAEVGIEDFPMISYVTKADAARLNLESV